MNTKFWVCKPALTLEVEEAISNLNTSWENTWDFISFIAKSDGRIREETQPVFTEQEKGG